MILVDHQIEQLCVGIVPEDLQFYYSSLWENMPSKIHPIVEPFDHCNVNPASLDICVGETAKLRVIEGFWAKLWRKSRNFWRWYRNQVEIISRWRPLQYLPAPSKHQSVDLSQYSKDNPYWLKPGNRILVASLETFYLPNFVCAQFRLKSSRGREWYEHMEAGFCDPGWHGSKLTMEIINMDLEALPLYPGLRMGQLVFSLTLGTPRDNYAVTGRYNEDTSVEESKG